MTLTNYLLQTNLYLVLFYGFYRLLLHKETHFIFNRIYLLAAVAMSFCIPYLRLEWFTQQSVSNVFKINLSDVLLNAEESPVQKFDWGQTLLVVYFAGTFLTALLLVYKLLSVKKLLKKPIQGSAFSFLRFKVVDRHLTDFETINRHEEIHIRQMHSLDILFVEIAGILTWFNPIIYLYKISLKDVHEYLADEGAAEHEGDKRKYALMLLKGALGVSPALSNSFFKQSLIKKRIFMLQKERSGKKSLVKYGMAIPLLLLLTFFSSAIASNGNYHPDVAFSTKPEKVGEQTTEPPKEQSDAHNHGTSFPGGYDQFRTYLRNSVQYPVKARKNKIGGRVVLSFIIDTDGLVKEAKVIQSAGNGLDEEAIRIIQHSPRWNPGIQNGAPIRVMHQIGINFNI